MSIRLGRVSVDVEINADDFLGNISTRDLMQYIMERRDLSDDNKSILEGDDSFTSLVKEAYERLSDGDVAMCRLVLERALFPKFKTTANCIIKLKAAH